MAAIPVTSTSPGRAVKPTSGTMQTVQGSTGTHSFLKEEQVAFAEHINHVLSNDTFLTSKGYLPIQVDSQDGLYAAVSDGILLCKMINLAHPDTVDERALNLPTQRGDLNPWELTENVNMAINSARAIGCSIVNVHAKDITHAIETHREYLVLGVVWQVVRAQLLAAVNLKEHPELVALLGEGEDLKTFMKLPAEEVLIRWINYHLGREGIDRRVSNLGGDVKDGVPYIHLLHSIDGSKVNVQSAMAQDPNGRAAAAIAACRALNVPTFVTPNDITSGNKRLNLAFTAQLFNSCPGLTIKEEEKQAIFEAAGMLEDSEDARETRVFRFWLNSMNLSDPNTGTTYYIHDLFDELGDGLILLHAIDRVAPGAVDWKKVNTDRSKLNKYKRIENCNYCVTVGKELGFSLPGIGGVDIENGNTKLVLGYLWQLMRMSLLRMLQSIGGPGGVPPKDSDILEWANKTAGESGRNEHAISSFKDPSLSTSLFLLDVLAAVEPRAINPELVTPGSSEDEKSKNAKYVISVARKLGCVVFLTHEDITDVKPKMILTLLASMMHRAKEMAAGITTPAGVPGGQGIGTSAGSALDSARSRTGSAGDQQQQVSSARSSDAAGAGVGVAAVGASTSARGAGSISSGGGLGKGMGTTTTATATTTTTGTTIVGGHSWPPQKTGGSPPGPQQMPSKAQFGGAQPGQPGGTGGSPGQVPSGGGAPMLSKSAAGSSAAQRYLAGIGGPGAGAQQGEK